MRDITMTTQETNGTTMVKHTEPGPGLVKVETTRAFEPVGIQEAFHLAGILVASRLLPRAVTTPEAAFAIIMTGRELGLTAMQSLRSIHVIEGKTTLSADLIASLVKSNRDVCHWFRLVESTDQIATYETHRVGEPSPTRMSFSWSDATRAGLTGKDNWKKYPSAMLRARCITALARAVYPDLAMGLYDTEEIETVAPRAPYEVIVTTPPASREVAIRSLLEATRERIAAATTVTDVNREAKAAGKHYSNGQISGDELEIIKRDVLAKRAELNVPGASPSEPVVEPDATHGAPGDG